MFRQLLRLGTREPQALADHVEAYSELAASELKIVAAQWQRSVALQVLVYASYLLALSLLGTALLLWAVLPGERLGQVGLMLAVPLLPAGYGYWLSRRAHVVAAPALFLNLRRQWATDRAMLHLLRDP